jgi:cardiolipin synthase
MLNIDLRNHRKLLIVDRRLAFTGGMNIRDCQRLFPPGPHSTADLHFRVEGAVVEQLEAVFINDWHFSTGESLPACGPVPAAGHSVCRVIADGPNQEVEILVMILLGALAAAHRRVLIMTPYFIPGAALLAGLQSAALRGVVVDVVLPARSNQRYVDWASRKFLEQLLKCGVRIWLRPAPFAHSKLFVIDDDYAQVGSANLDQRSLRLNFELILELYDPAVVALLAIHHDEVRGGCKPLGSDALAARPVTERLRDGICWLFSPYL